MSKTLIVEDSSFYRQLFKEALRSKFPSMEISEASNGDEALQKVARLHPHIVFMDIKLPGENGLELTKKIKDQYPEIQVVILTGYDIPEYREAAFKNKANHFLSKGSATKENILDLVQSILSDLKTNEPS